jgi:uncharacterized protein YuzE
MNKTTMTYFKDEDILHIVISYEKEANSIELTHQLHNFCSICEADMLKKPDQRYLTAHQPGQPAFLQNALKVKCTVMCIRIKFYRFGGVFQHICLTFYATFRLSPNITAEMNERGELIGIEILEASSFIRDSILESSQAKILELKKAV